MPSQYAAISASLLSNRLFHIKPLSEVLHILKWLEIDSWLNETFLLHLGGAHQVTLTQISAQQA